MLILLNERLEAIDWVDEDGRQVFSMLPPTESSLIEDVF